MLVPGWAILSASRSRDRHGDGDEGGRTVQSRGCTASVLWEVGFLQQGGPWKKHPLGARTVLPFQETSLCGTWSWLTRSPESMLKAPDSFSDTVPTEEMFGSFGGFGIARHLS